jgi:hypothetical protein
VSFRWSGTDLDYFDHPYNTTAINERAVEIPIALTFLARHGHGVGLEIGNVLGHYGITGHDIVDLYELGPGVRNIDVFDVTGRRDWIVSISTIEHIGWDHGPIDPEAAIGAIKHLRSLLAPDGHLLVTVPLGHHPHLDGEIIHGTLEPTEETTYVRVGDRGWEPAERGTWKPYGETTPWAEAVWIARWGPTTGTPA